MQLMNRGSLFDILKLSKLSHSDILKYFRQLVLSVEYLHTKLNIVHRDIKPENLLIDDDGNIKLADFGISVELTGDDTFTDTAGSNYYMCPECCQGLPYSGKSADIWACGVTLYQLVHGRYPFNGKTHVELNMSITESEPVFDEKVPLALKSLLIGLLTKNPDQRFTFEDIRHNEWVTKNNTLPLEPVAE